MSKSDRPTFIDLFSGCGGLTRGFLDARFELLAGYESELQPATTFAANFGEPRTHLTDASLLADVPAADVVVGGPPCQGFSNLGKRDPADERNALWDSFVDAVVQSECGVFVLENVERFSKSVELGKLRKETGARGRLRGWDLQPYSLNAADFGVAQRRIRSIIVGTCIGPIDDPLHTHSSDGGNGTSPWRTVRDAIGTVPFAEDLPTSFPDRTVDCFGERVQGAFKLPEIHVDRTYRDISIRRYNRIAPGRSRFDLPDDLQMSCWRQHQSGAADVLGRLEWEKPAVTIRTEFFKPEKGRYLHPEWNRRGLRINRALTHAEAALLQGFDDRHLWCGSKREVARQIGNAVPPPLARAIAERILDAFG